MQSTDFLEREMSAESYNAAFSLTTLSGLVVYIALAALSRRSLTSVEYLLMLIPLFFAAILSKSDDIMVKLCAFYSMSGILGYISGPALSHFKAVSIINISVMTAFITLVLCAVGWIIPSSMEKFGSLLFVSLLGLIVGMFALPPLMSVFGYPSNTAVSMLDWFGVVIFSGFIVYDFHEAQYQEKTFANAIDVGISLFLDILNLFLNLLSLFGDTDD